MDKFVAYLLIIVLVFITYLFIAFVEKLLKTPREKMVEMAKTRRQRVLERLKQL